jgi:CRP/FNR family cyclic AMP-dependent transcriptional regulator
MSVDELGISGLNLIGEGSGFKDTLFDMLSEAQLFNRVEGHEIRQLTEYVHAYAVDAGVNIFPEGMQGNCMGLLVSGRIEVLKKNSSGEAQRIATITAGKTFGEMSLIDGLPYSATIRALESCTVILLTRNNFTQCVQRHPALGVKLLTEIARLISLRLRQTSGQLVDALGG